MKHPQQFRWKPMDVAFADNTRNPQRLMLEVNKQYHCYTTISQSDGVGSHSEYSLLTLDEWLIWLERFREDLTGRELRECREAATAPFTEPQSWAEMRKRHAETGDAFINAKSK
jgi:hypothetical protein